jgi:hypothetical protein
MTEGRDVRWRFIKIMKQWQLDQSLSPESKRPTHHPPIPTAMQQISQ